MPLDVNHNEFADDDYFFKKYYTWRGQARIARSPSSMQVVVDTIHAQMTSARKRDEGEYQAALAYCLTLIQAWEDGCRSDCVGECSCEHREFPRQLVGFA